MEDAKIIELLECRSQYAVKELHSKYGGYCNALADRILHDREDVEECVNDTWWRVWNAIPPARPENLKLFVARITRNIALDRYRRHGAERRGGGVPALALEELSECVPASGSVEQELEARELGGAINRFLHDLPERQANIFIRRYFYFETSGVIAERYGMSEGNVNMTLSRTRRKLLHHLAKEGYVYESR